MMEPMTRDELIERTRSLIADGEALVADPTLDGLRAWIAASDRHLAEAWGHMDRYHLSWLMVGRPSGAVRGRIEASDTTFREGDQSPGYFSHEPPPSSCLRPARYLTVSDSTHNADRLIIFDTTLRDGEQSPGCSMNLAEKLQVAHALKDLGVDVVEAGFPIASPGDFEAVQAIARELHGPVICGLARCNQSTTHRTRAPCSSRANAS